MAWIKNINDLSFYNTPNGVECYCAPIIRANDLTLQGIMDFNGQLSSYSATITAYTPDGITSLGEVTTSFNISYAANPIGGHFFNAILRTITGAICANPCFVLRVQIKTGTVTYFDYFTDKYCVKGECCDSPDDITITQTDVVLPPPNVVGGGTIPTTGTVTSGNNIGSCDENYLLLETFSDCFNKLSGKYYKPVNNRRYINKFNIKGRVKIMPYEVQRDNSLNCRLQRSTITKLYEFEGFDLYDANFMDEVTLSLTDQYIFIDGRRYEMATNTPFEPVQIAGNCNLLYRLRVQLQDCTAWQIHGCGDGCESKSQAFVIPNGMVQQGNYYDENKQYIGNTLDELKNYYQTYPNAVVTITDLDPEDYGCTFYAGFVVEAQGYVPTYFYIDNPSAAANRVYGIDPNNLDVCDTVAVQCQAPVLGTIINDEMICAAPEIGAIVNSPVPEVALYMTGAGTGEDEWVLENNNAYTSQNQIFLKFEVSNAFLTYDSGDPEAEMPTFSGQIAYVSQAGWPLQPKQFTQSQCPELPEDAIVIVQPDGKIEYNGTVTTADLTGSLISITSIIYTP